MAKSKSVRSKAGSIIAAIANPSSAVCIACAMDVKCAAAGCVCPKCRASSASQK